MLVLDDYHLIHERAIHEIMTELTRHPPPALHLVFAARNDPAAAVGQPAGARPMSSNCARLICAFRWQETDSFLREEMRLQVDDQTVA